MAVTRVSSAAQLLTCGRAPYGDGCEGGYGCGSIGGHASGGARTSTTGARVKTACAQRRRARIFVLTTVVASRAQAKFHVSTKSTPKTAEMATSK